MFDGPNIRLRAGHPDLELHFEEILADDWVGRKGTQSTWTAELRCLKRNLIPASSYSAKHAASALTSVKSASDLSIAVVIATPRGMALKCLQADGVLATDRREVEPMQRQTLETLTAPIRRQWQCNR